VLLFFDPTGHGCTRDTKRVHEAAQTAALLRGMEDLLAASWWRGIGRRILATATPTGMTAILLFAVGSVPVSHQGLASTVETVKDDGYYWERSSFFHLSSQSTISFSLVPLPETGRAACRCPATRSRRARPAQARGL
jgi:hypothetical protein